MDKHWYYTQAAKSWARLMPRIKPLLNSVDFEKFSARTAVHFPTLFELLHRLYGDQYDFLFHLENILSRAAMCLRDRPATLKHLDDVREANPDWYQSHSMMGAVCYVDRFSGTLHGLQDKLDYLEELGITYLHLMPLFECPPQKNDGGYAVSSFRRVNPAIGSMEELSALSDTLRARGISLVLDFVFNHTSEEHDWAQRALSGDTRYQAYYHMFDTREIPNAYEQNLREIFPEQAPGSFTWRPEINKWVWSTFFSFQWDLNYANPELFAAMLEEMLFLANQGVEVLRLDAVPFIWKKLGTNCENLPEAHLLIQAFNAIVRICAPALLFKSEAIVHPRDVQSYISPAECQLSYNPILMVCLWDAVATRDARLLTKTLTKRFALPKSTAWVNYIRSHDDIGWGFADEDAAEVGINGADHRYFLNQFYTGSFPGSFARGVPFNYNPITRDMRISGTSASLMGLEEAIERADDLLTEHAIRRIILCQSIVLAVGGIPLIYLGDEVGTLNDYSYRKDPHLAEDSRWIHRPNFDWIAAAQRNTPDTITGRIYQQLRHMIQLRKTLPMLSGGNTTIFDVGNPHLLVFSRKDKLIVVGNFSDRNQNIQLGAYVPVANDNILQDLLTGEQFNGAIGVDPWQIRWLIPADATNRVADAAPEA